ncbi:MazG family protein [Bacillus paranthracis]
MVAHGIKKQTHQSLKKYLIEEAYEVLEAIDEEDDDHLVEELGDILLQVMLHAQIGEDEGWFSIDDIIRTLSEKMVRRHPHVFGNTDVNNADEVIANWEEIKKQEKRVCKRICFKWGSKKVCRSYYALMKSRKKLVRLVSIGLMYSR